jgi:hypothetical protein
MYFRDNEIEKLNLTNAQDLASLIVKYLCGKTYELVLSEENKILLSELTKNAITNGLNYRQFNELLLLLNQDKVSKDFFLFFFGNEKIKLNELKVGITNFRGFAMLCFGNFRFAFRKLRLSDIITLKNDLKPVYQQTIELEKEFENRPPKMLETTAISRDLIWHLGEVSGKITNEAEVLEKELKKAKKGKSNFAIEELLEFKDELLKADQQIEEARKIALNNTDIYLTWDYMDVYVATSMRNKWEYQETFDFLIKVFEDEKLKRLNLRFFDPTQSICSNPRDKGLVEGLMLKRASCTIYLAQESDTMGKDSELAATLTQRKTVVAYVPEHDPEEYARTISKYPLDYFKIRIQLLDSEGVFRDLECSKKLALYNKNFFNLINRFQRSLEKYRSIQPFTLWDKREEEFKNGFKDFNSICKILAIAECDHFDKRAKLLKERHPLCMQVDPQSGVSNGVLVVRNEKDCSDLLQKILTNQTEFILTHVSLGKDEAARETGYTILQEKISGSAYRLVTDYERLTNSFWNFFG